MPKSKKNVVDNSQNTAYYAARVVQRVSLLLAAASTAILWATLIAITHTTGLWQYYIDNAKISDFNELSQGITNEISTLTDYAIFFSMLAIAVSLLIYTLPRVKKFDKRVVVDGVTLAGFCFIFAVWCEPIYRMILSRLA